jgi:hypothetical protein
VVHVCLGGFLMRALGQIVGNKIVVLFEQIYLRELCV